MIIVKIYTLTLPRFEKGRSIRWRLYNIIYNFDFYISTIFENILRIKIKIYYYEGKNNFYKNKLIMKNI